MGPGPQSQGCPRACGIGIFPACPADTPAIPSPVWGTRASQLAFLGEQLPRWFVTSLLPVSCPHRPSPDPGGCLQQHPLSWAEHPSFPVPAQTHGPCRWGPGPPTRVTAGAGDQRTGRSRCVETAKSDAAAARAAHPKRSPVRKHR